MLSEFLRGLRISYQSIIHGAKTARNKLHQSILNQLACRKMIFCTLNWFKSILSFVWNAPPNHQIINSDTDVGFYEDISTLHNNLLSYSLFLCISASRILKINCSKPDVNDIPWKIQNTACQDFIVLKRNQLPKNLDLDPSSLCWSQQARHKGLAFRVRRCEA